MRDVVIDPTWKKELQEEFTKPYWETLTSFVREEYTGKTVYPSAKHVFRAFNVCPFDQVKVVIVGQDPYHGVNQANGLCFAVHDKIPLPPSLQNIFKEIQNDLGITTIPSGNLSRWASQGVLMLNSVLTVRAHSPASHSGKGWEIFTDAVIRGLNDHHKHIVYMLWGKYAQTKGAAINRTENLVLTSGHPSPYSVSLFYGNHHFSKCNEYLKKHNVKPVDWR